MKTILEAILEEPPFKHYKKFGDDDWRDPNESNSSLSISSRGYFDHRSNKCGSLFKLAKAYQLSNINNFKDNSDESFENQIWSKSQLARDSSSVAYKYISTYLTEYRKIPKNAYEDLLNKGVIRLNQYKNENMIVYPSFSIEDSNNAYYKKFYHVGRIHRIVLNSDGSKKNKKHLGTLKAEHIGFVIPPLKKTQESIAVVTEGLEDALSIRGMNPIVWFVVASDKNGLENTSQYFEVNRFSSVMIIADHDSDDDPAHTGQAYAWRLGEKLKKLNQAKVQVCMPSIPKDDANQALQEGRYAEWENSLVEIPDKFRTGFNDKNAGDDKFSSEPKPLTVLTLEELLNYEVAPRKYLLEPWLPEQGLVMIYAARGAGKSWFALSLANAIAKGQRFLKWSAPSPKKVLYIDGEMPLSMIKERIEKIIIKESTRDQCFHFINPDPQKMGIPNLSEPEGQKIIDDYIKNYDLVILDNLSTLMRSGIENESESWLPIQEWALKHRSKGKSIVFIHHAGKSGNQRGTSRREDALDTVIALKKPSDYSPDQGARFEIHFEKARGIYGEDVEPLECNLENDQSGNLKWEYKLIEGSTREQVLKLYSQGMKKTEIADKLGIARSGVTRHIQREGDF